MTSRLSIQASLSSDRNIDGINNKWTSFKSSMYQLVDRPRLWACMVARTVYLRFKIIQTIHFHAKDNIQMFRACDSWMQPWWTFFIPGGLNEEGRKSYEKENPGSDLKKPQPEGGSRKKSFCARMCGMKKKLTSAKTARDPDSRINKALRKWDC